MTHPSPTRRSSDLDLGAYQAIASEHRFFAALRAADREFGDQHFARGGEEAAAAQRAQHALPAVGIARQRPVEPEIVDVHMRIELALDRKSTRLKSSH